MEGKELMQKTGGTGLVDIYERRTRIFTYDCAQILCQFRQPCVPWSNDKQPAISTETEIGGVCPAQRKVSHSNNEYWRHMRCNHGQLSDAQHALRPLKLISWERHSIKGATFWDCQQNFQEISKAGRTYLMTTFSAFRSL